MKITEKELYTIKGGTSAVSASLLNSIAKIIDCVLDVGRTIGSAIRMVFDDTKYC